MGNLLHLRVLDAQQTSIGTLPPEIAFCQELETLLLWGNVIESLPETLKQIPKLSTLAINYRSFCSMVDGYMENLLRKVGFHFRLMQQFFLPLYIWSPVDLLSMGFLGLKLHVVLKCSKLKNILWDNGFQSMIAKSSVLYQCLRNVRGMFGFLVLILYI